MKKIVIALKLNQIKLNRDVETKMYNNIKTLINPQNVATYYHLSKIFSLNKLSSKTKAYINCWFTTVAETNNFLELNIVLVKKVLLSSLLYITSEIEVFTAADSWITYKLNRRKKHSKDLLMTVRLSLLSKHALKHLLHRDSSFKKVNECQTIINETIELKKISKQNKKSINIKNCTRYCGENNFDILHCGEIEDSMNEEDLYRRFVNKIDGRNLIRCRKVRSLNKNRIFPYGRSPTVYLKGHVYLFDCLRNKGKGLKKIGKYSIATDSLEIVGDIINERQSFCVCGFIDKIYFIGGFLNGKKTANCRYFDTNDNTWGNVTSMKEVRSSAACTVYEGRIVVAGGWDVNYELNTVESFDHIANKWSFLPSMIKSRSYHRLIAIKHKLFAIGGHGQIFEVYDSTCKKFVSVLNSPRDFSVEAISLENKVLVLSRARSTYSCYNVDNDEWTTESCIETADSNNKFTVIPKLTLS